MYDWIVLSNNVLTRQALAIQDHGKTSATASLGLITLWDVEGGLPQIDKYLYSQDSAVVAGALLGVGIINSSVQAR